MSLATRQKQSLFKSGGPQSGPHLCVSMSITIKGNIGEGDFLPWINSTSKEGFLEHLHTSNGPPLSK